MKRYLGIQYARSRSGAIKGVTNEFNIDYPVSEDVSILAEPVNLPAEGNSKFYEFIRWRI